MLIRKVYLFLSLIIGIDFAFLFYIVGCIFCSILYRIDIYFVFFYNLKEKNMSLLKTINNMPLRRKLAMSMIAVALPLVIVAQIMYYDYPQLT